MAGTPPIPPIAWLRQLHEARRWDRLEQLARERLAADPSDTLTHGLLGWALYHLDRPQEGLDHATAVLQEDPDSENGHKLSAVLLLELKQFKEAKSHIDELIRQDPRDATYHYIACLHALHTNQVKEARACIQKARSLSPDWGAALEMEIKLDGIYQKGASEAWRRIRKFEAALTLNPESGSALAGIGDIYLKELEQPVKAEEQYRAALFLEPGNKVWQRDLLNAVRARSLLYRTLSLPETTLRRFSNSKPGGCLLIVMVKPLMLYFGWLIIVGGLFYPASKLYQAIVLSAALPPRPLPRFLRPFQAVRRWPLGLRMGLALLAICGFWTALAWQLFDCHPTSTLLTMSWIFGIHFSLVALWVGLKRLLSLSGRRRERREWMKSLSGAGTDPVRLPVE